MSGRSSSSSNLTEEVERSLAAFEALTSSQLCFRPVAQRWNALGDHGRVEPYANHRSEFCVEQKAKNLPTCLRCDNQDAFLACEGREEAFVRRCHAGAEELLLPLRADGSLTGVVFLGQLSVPGRPRDESATPPTEVLVGALDALRARLMEIFAELGTDEAARWRGPMALVIEEYLRESLATGPTLTELAGRMRLSVSRAGHVVRETTGESFNQLVERRRIEMATELLTRTDGTIGWIARQVGFADTGYFSRYFKKRTGVTPGAYRAENGRPLPV